MLNKEISLACFDLDGTLADTSDGIYAAYTYTCCQLGISANTTAAQLKGVIGGRPIDIFQEKWGLDRAAAETAVGIYRNYYGENGLCSAVLYPGIEKLLQQLRLKDYILAVTTLKYDPYAKKILEYLGIGRYFHGIYGCGAENLDTKVTLLQHAMKNLHKESTQTVLVGDSEADAYGARAAGVKFVGVTYGLGFRTQEELSVYQPYHIVEDSTELSYVFGL